MLQAYTGERGERLIVGVTRGNIDRLTAGKPMRVQIAEHVSVREVIVVFGEDKHAIVAELESAGLEFAQAHKDAVAADPL